MSFYCSYRNKNEPSAIYPSFGYKTIDPHSWKPAIGGRPHRRPPRRLASPVHFFLADCGGLSVGWVSCSDVRPEHVKLQVLLGKPQVAQYDDLAFLLQTDKGRVIFLRLRRVQAQAPTALRGHLYSRSSRTQLRTTRAPRASLPGTHRGRSAPADEGRRL
jgi:hypothetical protein